MKKTGKYILLALLMLSALLLSGCAPTLKEGIEVAPADEAVSEAARERAAQIIAPLIALYFEDMQTKPSAEELAELTAEAVEITALGGLGEREYGHFLDVLERRGAGIVSLIAQADPTADYLSAIGTCYFELAEGIDADYIGDAAFELCIMGFDYRIRTLAEAGDAVSNVLKAQRENERDTLINNVGKSNFSRIIRLWLSLGGFFGSGELNLQAAERFSDRELLIFIKRIDFSGLTVDKEGYKLLAQYYNKYLSGDTYLDELMSSAYNNGDIDTFAECAQELPALLSGVISRLDTADMQLLRLGDRDALISSVFEKLGDADWELFARVFEVEISSDRYDAIAEEFFGEDFLSFKAQTEAVSLHELRAAVGGEGFSSALIGYIYGICPAFAYASDIQNVS